MNHKDILKSKTLEELFHVRDLILMNYQMYSERHKAEFWGYYHIKYEILRKK